MVSHQGGLIRRVTTAGQTAHFHHWSHRDSPKLLHLCESAQHKMTPCVGVHDGLTTTATKITTAGQTPHQASIAGHITIPQSTVSLKNSIIKRTTCPSTYSGLTPIPAKAVAAGETPCSIARHVTAHLNVLLLDETAHHAQGARIKDSVPAKKH